MASSNLSERTANSSTDHDSDIQYEESTGTFLVLFILLGTIGNGFIIVSIITSKRLRSSSLHLLTLNLAVVNVLECLLNMTFNLTAILSTETLQEESIICKLNAFFISVIWIESILGITFMIVERMVAMKNFEKVDVMQRPRRIIIMIVYTWIHAVAFSLPLTTGLVPVSIYSDINACMISVKSSVVYIGTVSICCLIVPVIVTLILIIMTMKTALTEKSIVQAQITRHQYSNDVVEPKFFKEFGGTKFSGIIFVCWLILVAPFVMAIFIYLYQYSDMNLVSGLKLSDSSIAYFILLWVKYFNIFMLPVFSFFYKKEFWQNFKDVIFCKKKNSVNDVTNENNRLSLDSQDKIERIEAGEKKMKDEKMKEAFIHNSGFQVPVLFATSYGVHIQTSESEVIVDNEGTRGKKCDVLGSQEHLQQFGDDTSDYDSGNELDPFSVSHPVSSKNLKNENQSLQNRSNSQPEVRSSRKNRSTDPQTSVTLTSAADSGLDISSNKSGLHQSTESYKYDRSLSSPADVTNLPNPPHTSSSEIIAQETHKKTSDSINIESAHNATNHKLKLSAKNGHDNSAYKDDESENNIRHSNSPGQQVHIEQTSENDPNSDHLSDGQKNILTKNMSENDGASISSSVNCEEWKNAEGNVEAKMSDTVPPTPNKKKKKPRKQPKGSRGGGILRNGNDDTSPPRPPPRLAPLQGCHPPLYQRMTEAENDTQENAFPSNSTGDMGFVSNKASVYEVKRDKKLKGKNNRERSGDSETSLLDSGSSSELKSLKEAMFGVADSEGYSSQVLEVTTPSACKLMDLSKDFENRTPSGTPDPASV